MSTKKKVLLINYITNQKTKPKMNEFPKEEDVKKIRIQINYN